MSAGSQPTVASYDSIGIDDHLAYNTVYTVTVGTGARDRAGNPLASPTSFSFRTEPDPGIEIAYREFGPAPGYRAGTVVEVDRTWRRSEAGDRVTIGKDELHVAYLDAAGLHYRYSPNGGKDWAPAEPVPAIGTPDQIFPRLVLAVDREDKIHIFYSYNPFLPAAGPENDSSWNLMHLENTNGVWEPHELLNHAAYDRGRDDDPRCTAPLDNGVVPIGASIDMLDYIHVLAKHEGSCAYGAPIWEITLAGVRPAGGKQLENDPICETVRCVDGSCTGFDGALDIDTSELDLSVTGTEILVVSPGASLAIEGLSTGGFGPPDSVTHVGAAEPSWYDYLNNFVEDPTIAIDSDLWNMLQAEGLDGALDELAEDLSSLSWDDQGNIALTELAKACGAVLLHEPAETFRYFKDGAEAAPPLQTSFSPSLWTFYPNGESPALFVEFEEIAQLFYFRREGGGWSSMQPLTQGGGMLMEGRVSHVCLGRKENGSAGASPRGLVFSPNLGMLFFFYQVGTKW